MAQSAAHLVEHVIPRVPVRQWVLSLPIPLRLQLAAQPLPVTLVLQVVHRVISSHLPEQTGPKARQADSGAVTLIERFGSAANRNIHLHCLVLEGLYRRRSLDRCDGSMEIGSPGRLGTGTNGAQAIDPSASHSLAFRRPDLGSNQVPATDSPAPSDSLARAAS